jgi:hypothetical protein
MKIVLDVILTLSHQFRAVSKVGVNMKIRLTVTTQYRTGSGSDRMLALDRGKNSYNRSLIAGIRSLLYI